MSTTVSNVTGSTAKVVYAYGLCGRDAPGSFVDYNAAINDNTLVADIGMATVSYKVTEPNVATGTSRWDRSASGAQTGTFRRGG